MEEKQALVQVTNLFIMVMVMLTVMVMVLLYLIEKETQYVDIMIMMMILSQANLELKERMESALEREERARAELQDSKDQVGITISDDEKICVQRFSRLSCRKLLPGGAPRVPCA